MTVYHYLFNDFRALRCRKGAGWEVCKEKGSRTTCSRFSPTQVRPSFIKVLRSGLFSIRGPSPCHTWNAILHRLPHGEGAEQGLGVRGRRRRSVLVWEKGSQSIPTSPPFRTAMYPANTQKSDEIAPQRTAHRLNEISSIFCPTNPIFHVFQKIPVFMTWRSSVM